MISSIIQIIAILLLGFVLYKESKRDRISQIKEREWQSKRFLDMQGLITKETNCIISNVQAQDRTYSESTSSIKETIAFELAQHLVKITDAIAQSRAAANIESGFVHQLSEDIRQLQAPITSLAETQSRYITNEGESNRNLRRKLQDKQATLDATKSSLHDSEELIKELRNQVTQLSDLPAAIKDLKAELTNSQAIREKCADELQFYVQAVQDQLKSLHMPPDRVRDIMALIASDVHSRTHPPKDLLKEACAN